VKALELSPILRALFNILRTTMACGAAITLASCGGPPGSQDSDVGPREGASHPTVGQLAPDFAAENPNGAWLSLVSVKDKPVALLLFRPGAPFARELVEELGALRKDPAFAPTVFLGLALGPQETINRFVGARAMELPILRDPGSIAAKYDTGELPTVVLLDSDHIVRFRLDGYIGRHFRPRVKATIAALEAPAFNTLKQSGKTVAAKLRFLSPDLQNAVITLEFSTQVVSILNVPGSSQVPGSNGGGTLAKTTVELSVKNPSLSTA